MNYQTFLTPARRMVATVRIQEGDQMASLDVLLINVNQGGDVDYYTHALGWLSAYDPAALVGVTFEEEGASRCGTGR